MKLYLIQHGEAKSEAEDPERSLTSLSPSVAMKMQDRFVSLCSHCLL